MILIMTVIGASAPRGSEKIIHNTIPYNRIKVNKEFMAYVIAHFVIDIKIHYPLF